jgi:hypothetical protein
MSNFDEIKRMREEMELLMRVHADDVRQMNSSISEAIKQANRLKQQQREINELDAVRLTLQKKIQDAWAEHHAGLKTLTQDEQDLLDEEQKRVDTYKEIVEEMNKTNQAIKQQLSLSKALGNSMIEVGKGVADGIWKHMADIPGFLNDSDKAIRGLTTSLGASGVNADRIRTNFIESAEYAAQMGMSVSDLVEMQGQYAETTGTLALMSVKSAKAVSEIAKGTSLGVQGAGRMAAHFKTIGMSGVAVRDMVEDIVKGSESMGLNSMAVLNNLSSNFERMQEFTFSKGVKGMERMAQQAAKYKISMDGVFSAADKARTLEGALDMSANLMVLGGGFAAQADPLGLAHLAQTAPEQLQSTLGEMTKGLARWNSAQNNFEITALDTERLRAMSEATTIPLAQLKDAARQVAMLDKAKGQMTLGTDADKEMIALLSEIGDNGKMSVEIDGKSIDISKLTKAQIDLLTSERATLAERAKQAASFDMLWTNVLNEMKATLLPLLEAMNWALGGIRSMIDGFRDVIGGSLLPAVLALGTVGAGLKGAMMLGKLGFNGIGSMMGGGGATSVASSAIPGAAPTIGATASSGGRLSGMVGKLGNAFSSNAASIAAVGVALVGIGYGIKLATEGFANLGTVIGTLDKDQLDTMKSSFMWIAGGITAMVIAMSALAFSGVGLAGIGVLMSVGAAVMMIGGGISLATNGMSSLIGSLSQLNGMDITPLGKMFMAASSFLEGDTSNLNTLKDTVASINEGTIDVVGQLREIFSKPIQVEFKEGSASFNIDVTTQIGEEKFISKFAKKVSLAVKEGTMGKRLLS